jgi:regulator of replication initiation timing
MHRRLLALALFALPVACTSAKERARADSAQVLVAQQKELMTKLEAQKDSLSTVVSQADDFITKIDSSISRVKGLPKGKASSRKSESPIQDQVRARKEMLIRVNSLVERARITAKELAEARDKEKELLGENSKLRAELDSAGQRIADLTAQIERQAQSIALLQTHVDSLDKELNVARSAYSRAYYVIGREDDLVKKGIVVKEGGANLLVAHPGRLLLPARNLDRDLFQPLDIREIHEIEMPDTTRRYQIVSRQSLDDAEVNSRDGAQFSGTLKIANVDKFWAPSRFLIIVQR